jgi:hypothetical protein
MPGFLLRGARRVPPNTFYLETSMKNKKKISSTIMSDQERTHRLQIAGALGELLDMLATEAVQRLGLNNGAPAHPELSDKECERKTRGHKDFVTEHSGGNPRPDRTRS